MVRGVVRCTVGDGRDRGGEGGGGGTGGRYGFLAKEAPENNIKPGLR